MIDPRRLLVLRAVAAGGSIAQAARSLHLTPPAVSQQLAALEREVGITLVDRTGHRAVLTAAGRLLAQTAERINADLVDGERQLAELTGRLTGPVRIAAFQSVMHDLVAPALQQSAIDHPAVRPSFTERYGDAAVQELRRGDLDLVIFEHDTNDKPPGGPRLAATPLLFDPYRLVVPPAWQIRPLSIRDLIGHPWVGGPPGTACDRLLQRLLDGTDPGTYIVDVCIEFPTVLALVAAGRGAAIVPQLALQDEPVRTFPHVDLGGRRIGALYAHYRGQAKPAVRALLEVLTATAAGISS